ncbi:MAG: hypothetical protein E6R07_04935 [Nevskiaceae bacterium]|nr:MAG: hypothetical protein E6R07_04935 [Nevskiaceae bacterium]
MHVVSGSIVALRLLDVAYAIDLTQAEALWAQAAGPASRRGRLSTAPAKAMAFDAPPVIVPLSSVTLELDGQVHSADVTARLYDFGVVALALRLPVAEMAWADYERLFNAVDRTVGPGTQTALWRDGLERVQRLFVPAFHRPLVSGVEEDYLLGTVRAWNQPLTADELLDRIDLAPLLSGERRPLSEGARRELLRQRFSYYTDDLAVLTWDRAFIYEPRGDSDVAEVLEVANAQLLELRYYDELLDAELPRIYDLVEAARRSQYLLAPRRYAVLAGRLYTLVAEVTELTEKVDNALQVTEDVYLARVYSAALDLFRVRTVGAAVDRKLAIIRDTYAALHDEASSNRAELLEIAVVVLIVLEIVLALLRH